MSTSSLAAPPNTATSSITNSFPEVPPAVPSQDPSADNHAHPQSRLHLKSPTPLVEQPQPRAPEPISLENNSDAIALRAAISVLQMQRQQALTDMCTLEKQKTRALGDVEGFTKALADGSLKMRNNSGVLLEASAGEGDENREETSQADGQAPVSLQDRDSVPRDFEQMEIPGAQNVVRMPPVNWAKYHIIGESLDRLHSEQKVRPSAGVPGGTRREAQIAAPYDPFVDKLDATAKLESAGTGASGVRTVTPAEGMNTRRKSGGARKG